MCIVAFPMIIYDWILENTLPNSLAYKRSPITRRLLTLMSCINNIYAVQILHDDVIKWKHFPRYWPFVRGIHLSSVNSPHKCQWRVALMFSLNCPLNKRLSNNRKVGDLRRHCAHYDVIVMWIPSLENEALSNSSAISHMACMVACSKLFMHHHDGVIKWKHFPRFWPFVRGIYRSPANSPLWHHRIDELAQDKRHSSA